MKEPKRKEAVPIVEVKRIWRDDAIIYPDGRREGGWVECRVYQAERVPENRDGYISAGGNKPTLDQQGVETFADLWYRLLEKDVLEGRGPEKGEDDDDECD